MAHLQVPLVLPELNRLIDLKLKATLTSEQFNEVSYRTSNFAWITELVNVFQQVKIHTRVIWWKSVCGAWATSHRMHEHVLAPCVYGCLDCKDAFCHYLACPALWQLGREVVPEEETSNAVFRLALVSPSAQSLNRLAVAYTLHHDTENNHAEFDFELNYSVPNFVQHRPIGHLL